MNPTAQAAQTAPLPPIGNLPTSAGGPAPSGGMSAIMSGIAPVKSAVDAILAASQAIVQSGAVPGAEQVCSQIVALATSLLPMAAQQAMMPGPGGPASPGPGGPGPQAIGPVNPGGGANQ